jgi:F0F1-type ATP synthase assembly protein I
VGQETAEVGIYIRMSTREVVSTARRASQSSVMSGMARYGLAARAFVYLVIGWLAIQIALGHPSHQANQRGALAEVAQHPAGIVVLWILGFGLAAYAIWRLAEAAFGSAAGGSKASARGKALVRGLAYAAFAVSTFGFIAGRYRQGQSEQQETETARLMAHGYGRWLVGLAGLVVVGVGIGFIVEGVTRRFAAQLRMQELSGPTRAWVVTVGVIGSVARGVVFAIAGALVVDAAVTFDARKSSGLDGALRTLAGHAYGRWLLFLLAAGLIVFAMFGFAAARWAKTDPAT